VARARQQGILVTGSEVFAVGRGAVPHAVRIAVSSAPTAADVRQALVTLATLLAAEPGAPAEVL
jgi:DNA-binding transcriptional MocR family regulator